VTIKTAKDKAAKMTERSKKPESRKKPELPKINKKKLTLYIDQDLVEVLHVYAFQNRRKFSHVIEDLIEDHLKSKIKTDRLRTS